MLTSILIVQYLKFGNDHLPILEIRIKKISIWKR